MKDMTVTLKQPTGPAEIMSNMFEEIDQRREEVDNLEVELTAAQDELVTADQIHDNELFGMDLAIEFLHTKLTEAGISVTADGDLVAEVIAASLERSVRRIPKGEETDKGDLEAFLQEARTH